MKILCITQRVKIIFPLRVMFRINSVLHDSYTSICALGLIAVTLGNQEQLAAEGKRQKMEDILRLFAKNTDARYSRIPD